jgi:type I restriction enzyme S subunit
MKHISEKVAGAKMPRVSMDYFRSIDIELPPIDLQNQFAEFVEQTDKLKFEVKQSLDEFVTMKKALMQQYFG